jgi:phosphatidylinositol-4,5-bisphosphate 4-phosphatase
MNEISLNPSYPSAGLNINENETKTPQTNSPQKEYINNFIGHTFSYLNQLNSQHEQSQAEAQALGKDAAKENKTYVSFRTKTQAFAQATEKVKKIEKRLLEVAEQIPLPSAIDKTPEKKIKNLHKEIKKASKEIALLVKQMNVEARDHLISSQSHAFLVRKLQAGGLSAKVIKLLGQVFKVNSCSQAIKNFNFINNHLIHFGSRSPLTEAEMKDLTEVERDKFQDMSSSLKRRTGVIGINGVYRIQILFSKKAIKKQLTSHYVQHLSNRERKTISQPITFNTVNLSNSDSKPTTITFDSIPLNKEYDKHVSTVESQVFTQLMGNKGISTTNRQEAHLVNGWLSIAKNKAGEVIYSTIRHAILSDKFEKNKEIRQKNSKKAGTELVQALLLEELKLQGLTLEKAAKLNRPITLNVSSLSLVTPDDFRSLANRHTSEKQMLADHMTVWSQLKDKEKDYSEIKVGDQTIKVKLEVAKFNYGVNRGATSLFKLGSSNQYVYNKQGLKELNQHYKSFNEMLEKYGFDNPWFQVKNKEVLAGLKEDIDKLASSSTSYLAEGNQYELTAKIANFYNLMNHIIKNANKENRVKNDGLLSLPGFHVCLNCMSGKDRTGIADGMAKAFAVM